MLLAAVGMVGAGPDTTWMKATEVFLAKDDFERLDPFEAERLDAADDAFADREWREARAAYDAFMLEFPKSQVIAYALLRKGRAIQYDNKMTEALLTYTEIMDYFPNKVAYAAPALYYMGECRASQQKWKAALEHWKEMVEDVDYRTHPLAAACLNKLADGLHANGDYADAAKYYLQSATDFRRNEDWNVLYAAINGLLRVWVRDMPDLKALREACKTLRGFERGPEMKRAEDDQYFWDTVRAKIRELGDFLPKQEREREAYYKYWTKAMEGQMPKDDDFQKDLADFYLALDGKVDKWYARLDKQFNAYRKDGDNDRVAKWVLWYIDLPEKRSEYYRKLDLDATSNNTLVSLMRPLFCRKDARLLSMDVLHKLKLKDIPDREKGALAVSLYRARGYGPNASDQESLHAVAEPYALYLFKNYQDEMLGSWDELAYWHFRATQRYDAAAAERGVPLANKFSKTDYAQKAYWIQGDLLMQLGRIEEAIASYRATDDMPRNLFTIAGIMVRQGKYAAAVSELSQIEGSGAFPRQAPEAALEIADVWRRAGKQDLYVGALTLVIAKYPASREASDAHNLLESMGLSHLIRGGRPAE